MRQQGQVQQEVLRGNQLEVVTICDEGWMPRKSKMWHHYVFFWWCADLALVGLETERGGREIPAVVEGG